MKASDVLKSVVAGAAGACTLNLLHECTRREVGRAPRLDILGMRAVAATMRAVDREPPEHLRQTAMVSDVISNTAFYGLVGALGPCCPLTTGLSLGVAAGVGSIVLPGPLGLGTGPSARTRETQIMSVSLYAIGGLVAGAVYRLLSK